MPANALWLQQILSMFENSNLFLPFQNDANCAIGAKKNARNFHYIYLSLFSVKPFFSLCFCASIDGLQYILLPSIQSFRDCFRLPQLLGFFPRSLDSTYTKSVSNLSNFRQQRCYNQSFLNIVILFRLVLSCSFSSCKMSKALFIQQSKSKWS